MNRGSIHQIIDYRFFKSKDEKLKEKLLQTQNHSMANEVKKLLACHCEVGSKCIRIMDN